MSIFGKCNNEQGHGHNYVLEVTVVGEPNPVTGMVVNISDLKVWIKEAVLDILDHKNIDKQVEYFRDGGVVSTTENLAVFCWNQLNPIVIEHARLYKVKIWETEKNIVEYMGK